MAGMIKGDKTDHVVSHTSSALRKTATTLKKEMTGFAYLWLFAAWDGNG